MTQIGTLLRNGDGTFQGHLATSQRRVNLALERIPSAERDGEQAPHYRVLNVSGDGIKTELGAAWEKTKDERKYLSLTMDDPDWKGPLSCAAFPHKTRQNEFDVIWNRPQGRA